MSDAQDFAAQRDRLRPHFLAACTDLLVDGAWRPLATLPAPHCLIGAANPDGQALPAECNRRRDAVLAAELAARGLAPRRARGRDRAATWCEEGWLVAHERARDLALLARYGQLAAFVFSPCGRHLLWRDGSEEECHAEPS